MCASLTLLCLGVAIIYCHFKYHFLQHDFFDTQLKKIICWIFIICVFIGAIFCGIEAIAQHLDYLDAKAGKFQIITGTVVDYATVRSDRTKTRYSNPVFLDEETEKKVAINVGETKINKKYTVVYLPHSIFAKHGCIIASH